MIKLRHLAAASAVALSLGIAAPPASASTTSSDPAAASPSATPSPTPTVAQDVTIVGSTVQTRYGPLQLSVTFAGADITAVQALQAPSWHGESRQINAYAIPILTQEAVAADSASIDAVSGATVTTQAYRQSLQSTRYLEPFAERIELPRRARAEHLAVWTQRYAARLEHYCCKAPYQWFNFYDFWACPSGGASGRT